MTTETTKEYHFEVILHQGCDEFWETNPSGREVRDMLIQQIEATGAINIKRKDGYKFARDKVNLLDVITVKS